jgi:F-type H+-transporting ATPase subunit b
MQEIIQQVGNLMLGAVPTVLLFIVLVLAYQFLVQGPLTATLKERRARTDGAIEEAHKAIAQAEARAAEYAAKLRQARAEVYKVREQRVKQWNAERDAALDAARKAAGLKVGQAKGELEAEAAAASRRLSGVPVEIFDFVFAFFRTDFLVYVSSDVSCRSCDGAASPRRSAICAGRDSHIRVFLFAGFRPQCPAVRKR